MKKKIIALLMCCTAICCSIVGGSVSEFVNVPETSITASALHIFHSWKLTSEKAPTCTATGYKKYKCTKCTKTKTQTVKATGHSYKWVTTKKATCATTGTESHKCTKCGKIDKTRSIKALGHSYKWVTTKKPTCTATGTESHKCTKCGKIDKTKTIKALGHKYEKKSSKGRHYKQCKNCKNKLYTADNYKDDFKDYLKDQGFSSKEATMIFNYISKNGADVKNSSSFKTLMDYVGKIGKYGSPISKEVADKLSTISTAGTIAYNANSYIKSLKNKNGEAIMNSFIDLTSNICDLCPLTKGYSKILTSLKSSLNDVIKKGTRYNYKIYYTDLYCNYGTPSLKDLSNKSKYNSFVKYCDSNFGKDSYYVKQYYIEDLINKEFQKATGKTLDSYFKLFD